MAVLDEKYWQSFVGETIRGNTAWSNVYHIQKFLGRGGFGGVFKAEQDDTKELVAVKLMLPADAAAREIKTALKVPPHPNLIKHFEAIETDLKGAPMYVLVMELADGGSLRDLLNQRILNGVEVKKIALDIVKGLKHLHSIDATGSEEQKRVHRDMKPENVLQVNGVWKIADFGLAKVLGNGSMQASKTAGGTPQYMPPELLQRPHIVSTKWDIWSFGVILVEMLARERPFDSYQPDADQRENEIYRKILAAKPNIPNVPKEWIPIVEGCLIKKHSSRWMAADVLKALDAIGVPIPKKQPPTIPQPKPSSQKTTPVRARPSSSNRLWGTAITIGIVSGVGFMIWQFVKLVNSPPIISFPFISKTATDFFNDGYKKYDERNFQGAIADFNEAIRLNPNYVRAYARRGNTLKSLGQEEKAKYDFQKAISLVPKTDDDYLGRGNAKSELGDNKGAITDFNEAIRLNPNSADAYNNLGLRKSELGDKQRAIADFNEAIRLNPNFARPYYNRGNVKYKLGDKQGAIADFNEAIRLNPNFALAYGGRGAAKYELGDKQGAIADLNELIRLNPNFDPAYYGRGLAKSDLGDKQGAIADFNEAIRLKPDHADAYYSRGFIKQERGEKQEALADFRKASELYQQQGNTEWYNNSRDRIKELGGQ
jgi:serine/threonine protein kinase